MNEQIEAADYVLCVASPLYIKRFDGKEEPGKGLGSRWEGAIIYQALYEAQGKDAKFIALAFSRGDAETGIPLILRGPTRYVLEDDKAYDDLYRRLTKQPRIVVPPVGPIRVLAPEVNAHSSAGTNEIEVGRVPPVRVDTPTVRAVLRSAREPDLQSFAAKVCLLGPDEQNSVLSTLLDQISEGFAIRALGSVATRPPKGLAIQPLVTRAMKGAFLSGDVAVLTDFMKSWPVEVIATANVDVRAAFFSEIIRIMSADQYEDVNRVTPAVVVVQGAIPVSLHGAYVKALLGQTQSGAFQGKPAAVAALRELPDDLARVGLNALKTEDLLWASPHEVYRPFLENHRGNWPTEKRALFEDYVLLNDVAFVKKHGPF
jgi:hypothetical protein